MNYKSQITISDEYVAMLHLPTFDGHLTELTEEQAKVPWSKQEWPIQAQLLQVCSDTCHVSLPCTGTALQSIPVTRFTNHCFLSKIIIVVCCPSVAFWIKLRVEVQMNFNSIVKNNVFCHLTYQEMSLI